MLKLVKLTKDLEYKGKTYKKGSTWQLVQIDDREKIACLVNRKHVRIVVSSRDFVKTSFQGRSVKIAVWEATNKYGDKLTATFWLDNYGYHYETCYCWRYVANTKDVENAMEALTIAKTKHLPEVLKTRDVYKEYTDFEIAWVNKNYVD